MMDWCEEGLFLPLPPSPPSQDVHDNEVSALCFNNQGNYMATGGADKVVKVWIWRELQGRREARLRLTRIDGNILLAHREAGG